MGWFVRGLETFDGLLLGTSHELVTVTVSFGNPRSALVRVELIVKTTDRLTGLLVGKQCNHAVGAAGQETSKRFHSTKHHLGTCTAKQCSLQFLESNRRVISTRTVLRNVQLATAVRSSAACAQDDRALLACSADFCFFSEDPELPSSNGTCLLICL